MGETTELRSDVTAKFSFWLAMPLVVAAVFGMPVTSLAEQTISPGSPFLGGVVTDTATTDTLRLSIGEAIRRALDRNLGVLLANERVARAGGSRRVALAELLPHVSASVSEARRKTNLEAFGFPLRDGFPRVVGPFNVFDARMFLTQTVLDFDALASARAANFGLEAERLDYQDARDLVVLITASLYLEVITADARVSAANAQLATAQALFDQAVALRQAGLAAGIDVVRAEVQLSTNRQRATSARHDADKAKLQLARVIGLPADQTYVVVDMVPYEPAPTMPLSDALGRAYASRPDYLAAQERVREAEAHDRSARLGAMPSVQVSADYGTIGLTVGSALPTFSVAGEVQIPLFEGGRRAGRRVEAGSDLRARRAEVESLRAQIDYDVRAAFLDIEAASEAVQVATRAQDLADLQLTQARDRFAAGITTNLEVVQAQEVVAAAGEQRIAALYAFNVAKALLARAIGTTEGAVQAYLGGTTP